MNWIKRHRWLSAFLIAAVLLLSWRQYDRHFTPERWAETDISHRGKLVDSLLKQYDGLVGMTQAEVEKLLGLTPTEYRCRRPFTPTEAARKRPCWSTPQGAAPGPCFRSTSMSI